ncbi:MAG: permease-like cell division protein FtsX [Thermodesulfobacteriota bacterium]|nr:permease-like cell division protein FtsX [Thermodesulfobacteriota bacterium]
MHRLTYFIRIALNNISKNLVLNLVSVGIISAALLILGAFFLVQVNLQNLARSSTKDISLSVYLKDGLNSPTLARLKKQAAQMPGVASVRHISKKQALASLKKEFGDQGDLLEGLEENPLPASLELELKPEFRSEAAVKALIKKVEKLKGVDEARYAWDWAGKLKVFINFVRLSGLALGGLLFLVIIFIISNTIRLTVLARRDELYIMRLIGATENFIRMPFFIEGVLQGLCGGLAALAALFVLFKIIISQVSLPFGLAMVEFTFLPYSMSWLMVCAGAAVGLLGSFVSLGRFMRT